MIRFPRISLVIVLTASLWLAPAVLWAVGIAVRPSELNIAAETQRETLEMLTVSNPSREVALIEIYPDELEPIVRVSPASFLLESGEEREVAVTVKPQAVGTFHTHLSVVANPLVPGGFRASSGVKIPLVIRASSGNRSAPALAAAWIFKGDHPVFNRLVLLYAAAALLFLGFRYWQLHRSRRRGIKMPADGTFR